MTSLGDAGIAAETEPSDQRVFDAMVGASKAPYAVLTRIQGRPIDRVEPP
jgi:hypothetical protein